VRSAGQSRRRKTMPDDPAGHPSRPGSCRPRKPHRPLHPP
jgi:hypothetical protein